MPHRVGDTTYPHLPLVREDLSVDRRRGRGRPGPRPDRGGREAFASAFEERLEEIGAAAEAKVPTLGVQAHLVFRAPLAPTAPVEEIVERLEEAGLVVVGIEPDQAVIAFRDDVELGDFREAVATYRAGPAEGKKSTKWDLFEYLDVDSLRGLVARDRIGPRLRSVVGDEGAEVDATRLYTVEVELWHPGGRAGAVRYLDEVRSVVRIANRDDERLTDTFVGDSLCLAKVRVRGTTLTRLLNLDVIAEVDLPPTPVFDQAVANALTPRDFPAPPRPDADAPRLCVVDSGVTSNHPLIAANLGHAEAILTAGGDGTDQNGHGTMVCGIALYGSVRRSYERGAFASPLLLYSARVLNDENRFDDDRLIINQLRTAITTFYAAPYNCRVFNLSLGSDVPALANNGRQNIWAEELDVLARELKVLLVVSAGNRPFGELGTPEETLQTYPDYLASAAARLCEPATAAIPLTVGALAEHDVPAARQGLQQGDIVRSVAGALQPSPFTRGGPGVNDAIKPELVANGGNLVFVGTGGVRRISESDAGCAVMSLSREPLRTLFAYGAGTSLAAPFVARIAALLWSRLSRELGHDPDPNLIRALMANSAEVPVSAAAALGGLGDDAVLNACGYGVPDEELATLSGDTRATLIAEGTIQLDHFQVYALPFPPEFIRARGRKFIYVALAHDPPVRRRRQDYLGVEMGFQLIRGKRLQDVILAYKRAGKDEEKLNAFTGSAVLPFVPGPSRRNRGPSRKKSTLQHAKAYFVREGRDFGGLYWLVVRCEKKRWVPADITDQNYGLAVTLIADEPRLYQLVRARMQQRIRARAAQG